mmetsp:Transcript_3575/g.10397  ORF Transcript_3575/g.10397 Transcript_3575/m.10397 type:complete len:305 (+) Transcript_3575:238-1152(+)
MTKFEGEAIGVRGKKFKSYTAKDRKKDLELFKQTGVHPDVESARRRAQADSLSALPDSETGAGRPRTYIELSVGKRVLGRVVFEVFADVTPLPARAFVNRCRAGSSATVNGTTVHRVMPLLGIYFGNSSRYSGEAVKLKNLSSLRHVEEHTVSISPDGTEIVIALGRSLTLDASHMVVGRVQSGQEAIAAVLVLGTNAHDGPRQPVTITASGLTNAKGEVADDEADAEQRRHETPEETAARLKQLSRSAQHSIRDALQEALQQGGQKADAAAAASGAAKPVKAPASHYDVLGSDGSDSSSDDEQ